MEVFIFVFILFLLILSIAKFNISPFLSLLFFGLVYGIVSGIGFTESLNLLLEGFAKTLRWIAIIMIFGTIIGEILNETGGSEIIAQTTLKTFGKKRLPAAMSFTGFIISIPVFVDVAYIMMQSVTEALTARSKRNILDVGLSLVAGLTATHALLPPTPGPLAVAGILEADLGKVILTNFVVALAAMTAGLIWATYYCGKIRLPYDDKLLREHTATDEINTKNKFSKKLLAFLPILIPLFLIALSSFLNKENESSLNQSLIFLGRPVIALAVGLVLAMLNYSRKLGIKPLTKVTEKSIEKSALVIMITGAGGAFGHIIQSSGIVETISGFSVFAGNFGFLFPFLLAALFTTTTGSLTVSMITSASIVMPLLPSLGMSPQLAAALIGSGSFCVFHVNSSFFWLLNKLHNVPSNILLKTFTIQSFFMGIGGLLSVILMRVLGVL